MKLRVAPDEWTVVQDHFDPEANRVFESLFSLGNGHFGGRGNHEERYSGDSLRGNYLAGVYYPDPTRVGWWKNGYPDYFAKILNAADWTPIHIDIDGEPLDLGTATISSFRRVLDMGTAEVQRTFDATVPNGPAVTVDALRFVVMTRPQLGVIRYRLTARSDMTVTVSSQVNGDVVNEDSNHEAGFWDETERWVDGLRCGVVSTTRKTGFVCATTVETQVSIDGSPVGVEVEAVERDKFAASQFEVVLRAGQTLELIKFGANVTSRDVDAADVRPEAEAELDRAIVDGFDTIRAEHQAAWARKWELSDVVIEGDPAAQQGIRFNIFGLNSTFTGDDPTLNIGPKGFTGEKYGGVTYWDTEAFCLPFYLATSPPEVSRNLLLYRYRQLDRAIENATKLGFDGGAALYPMVTINGEECHNEWEITFEEIHRNGAIAFAIENYIRHTGDAAYLLDGGLEVLIAISRFWAQRVSYSPHRQAWVMLGVTGPNEYENNVDNNWYTNLMAQWTLRYTAAAIERAEAMDAARADAILTSIGFDAAAETPRWHEIADGIVLGHDPERDVFLQQDNYLSKELLTVDDLDPAIRPINQHWSWDRILRSCFIKQADVLQGLWVLEDQFDLATIERNFDFYEPRTVHESSLSPSIHAIHAARLGRLDKAHEMMLRTARLDLDDYNNDTEDGCHTTSMAGTWLAIVQGFGGMRVVGDTLRLDPKLAHGWTKLQFRIVFRGAELNVTTTADEVTIDNLGEALSLDVAGTAIEIGANATVVVPRV